MRKNHCRWFGCAIFYSGASLKRNSLYFSMCSPYGYSSCTPLGQAHLASPVVSSRSGAYWARKQGHLLIVQCTSEGDSCLAEKCASWPEGTCREVFWIGEFHFCFSRAADVTNGNQCRHIYSKNKENNMTLPLFLWLTQSHPPLSPSLMDMSVLPAALTFSLILFVLM